MKNIYNLLAEGNLAEALEWLYVKTEQIQSDDLSAMLNDVREEYVDLIRRTLDGEHNEEDEKTRQTLIRLAYSVNDRANRIIRLRKSPSSEYCLSITDSTSSPDDKFKKIWTSDLWNEEDEKQIHDLIYEGDEDDARFAPLYISAVFLSVMEMFDERKLMFLLNAYEHEDEHVSMRALTGFLLAIVRYDGRMNNYPQVEARFRLLLDEADFMDTCYMILSQLQYSKLTDSVTEKINKDIMPGLMKSAQLKKLMTEDSGEEELEENPEWSHKKDKIFMKKMSQMTHMHEDGADINMASFASLKRFPFFQTLSHWFLPYYEDIITREGVTVSDTVKTLLRISPFCDSDKYSFAIMMSTKGDSIIGKSIEKEVDSLKNTEDFDLKDAEKSLLTRTSILRSYIHDLYRFYTLYSLRQQFFNPFDKQLRSFSPLHRQSMKPLLQDKIQLAVLAEFFMKRGEYADAREMFLYLEPKEIEDDADLWQKIGFCEQKLEMPEALDTLLRADRLAPDSKWTVQHIAQVAFSQRQYETAIKYLDKLIEDEPEKLKLISKKAECLFALERYQDAIPLLYKVNYLDEDSVLGKQMLAWGLLMTGQYEKAGKLYAELDDIISLGHVAVAEGDRQLAYEYYSRAYAEMLKQSSGDATDRFKKEFWNLGTYLDRTGVDMQQLHLLYDATLMQAYKP